MMLRIVAPHFVAGIVRGGAVAPIIKYMKGWTLPQIQAYCQSKGWRVEILGDRSEADNQPLSTVRPDVRKAPCADPSV